MKSEERTSASCGQIRPSFPRPAMPPLNPNKGPARWENATHCGFSGIFAGTLSSRRNQPTCEVAGGTTYPIRSRSQRTTRPLWLGNHRAITALAREARACHKFSMNTEPMYPYSLEVFPCEKPAGHFQWAIRERGRLIQRSDRLHPSEPQAREKGQAELERLFFGGRDRR